MLVFTKYHKALLHRSGILAAAAYVTYA